MVALCPCLVSVSALGPRCGGRRSRGSGSAVYRELAALRGASPVGPGESGMELEGLAWANGVLQWVPPVRELLPRLSGLLGACRPFPVGAERSVRGPGDAVPLRGWRLSPVDAERSVLLGVLSYHGHLVGSVRQWAGGRGLLFVTQTRLVVSPLPAAPPVTLSLALSQLPSPPPAPSSSWASSGRCGSRTRSRCPRLRHPSRRSGSSTRGRAGRSQWGTRPEPNRAGAARWRKP